MKHRNQVKVRKALPWRLRKPKKQGTTFSSLWIADGFTLLLSVSCVRVSVEQNRPLPPNFLFPKMQKSHPLIQRFRTIPKNVLKWIGESTVCFSTFSNMRCFLLMIVKYMHPNRKTRICNIDGEPLYSYSFESHAQRLGLALFILCPRTFS